jgi:hypothetical protein
MPTIFRKFPISILPSRAFLPCVKAAQDIKTLSEPVLQRGGLSFGNPQMRIYHDPPKARFAPAIIGDMLCYLRLCTELGMRVKGQLILREAGYKFPRDSEINEKMTELKYLENSIGPTGRLAVAPILHTSGKSLWQMSLLE